MIGVAEDWLVAECRTVLGSSFPSIEPGPGEWTDRYLAALVKDPPAVRICFEGGEAANNAALDLTTHWSIYIVTKGAQTARRRGDEGGFRALRTLAPHLHNCVVPDVGRLRVEEIDNLWIGSGDVWQISVWAVGLSLDMPLDAPEIDPGRLVDWIRAGVQWDLSEGLDIDQQDVYEVDP